MLCFLTFYMCIFYKLSENCQEFDCIDYEDFEIYDSQVGLRGFRRVGVIKKLTLKE